MKFYKYIIVILLLSLCMSIYSKNQQEINHNNNYIIQNYISQVNISKAYKIVEEIAKKMKKDAILGRVELWGDDFKRISNTIIFQFNSYEIPLWHKLFGSKVINITIRLNYSDNKILKKELYYSGMKGHIEPLKRSPDKLSNPIDIFTILKRDDGFNEFIKKYPNYNFRIMISNFRDDISWEIYIYHKHSQPDNEEFYKVNIDDVSKEILTRWCSDNKIRDVVGIESRKY